MAHLLDPQRKGWWAEERIEPYLLPFTNIAVNCFRPIGVQRGRSVVKQYEFLFSCMTTWVHKVAYSLDTDECINDGYNLVFCALSARTGR